MSSSVPHCMRLQLSNYELQHTGQERCRLLHATLFSNPAISDAVQLPLNCASLNYSPCININNETAVIQERLLHPYFSDPLVLELFGRRPDVARFVLCTKRRFNGLTADYHIGLTEDMKDILSHELPMLFNITDYSVSVYCVHMGTCNTGQVPGWSFKRWNMYLYGVFKDRSRWFEDWKHRDFVKNADFVFSSHPPEHFQFFTPYNKSQIIFAAVGWSTFRSLTDNKPAEELVARLTKGQPAVLVANNPYHYAYFRKKFQAFSPFVGYLQSFCDYARRQYGEWNAASAVTTNGLPYFAWVGAKFGTPWNPQVNPRVLEDITRKNSIFLEKNPKKDFNSLLKFRGLVYYPYTLSVMSFYEQYSMGIPILFPSAKFLEQTFRKWINSAGGLDIEIMDAYYFPNITYYGSIEQLLHFLQQPPAYWEMVHGAMMRFNEAHRSLVRVEWTLMMHKLLSHLPDKDSYHTMVPQQKLQDVVKSLYGVSLP